MVKLASAKGKGMYTPRANASVDASGITIFGQKKPNLVMRLASVNTLHE